MQVYFCNIFQAFRFKMTLQESNSHRVTSLNVFKAFSSKETCKNERVTVLRHFYTVSFKLSVKNKTDKSQKVRNKTYKVVNLISRCASIISMDISMDLSMDIHIHGKPDYYTSFAIKAVSCTGCNAFLTTLVCVRMQCKKCCVLWPLCHFVRF